MARRPRLETRAPTRPCGSPWSKIDDQSLLLRGECEIGPALTVFLHAGGAHAWPVRTPTLINEAGDVRPTPQHFKFDIQRSTAEAGVRTRLETGPLQHAVTLQATQYRDRLERGAVNGTVLLTMRSRSWSTARRRPCCSGCSASARR